MSTPSFDIRLVAGRIGAEIIGVDLSRNLNDDLIRDLRAALVRYKVIFFRNQNLDAEGQIVFARHFGTPTAAHPTLPSTEEHLEVLDLDYGRTGQRANHWHTDVTFVDQPPFGSILCALEIPPVGGDTLWANTAAAYQDLPAPLKGLADTLWAIHSNEFDYAAAFNNTPKQWDEHWKVFTSTVYETRHPVVRIHPESQEKILLLGDFVRRFEGFSQTESVDLLRLFQSYVTRPENTVRWQWQTGDVAFWDNRSTQHYAIDDFGDAHRRVQRVTIAGEVPVSIDGKKSTAIKGSSTDYVVLTA